MLNYNPGYGNAFERFNEFNYFGVLFFKLVNFVSIFYHFCLNKVILVLKSFFTIRTIGNSINLNYNDWFFSKIPGVIIQKESLIIRIPIVFEANKPFFYTIRRGNGNLFFGSILV